MAIYVYETATGRLVSTILGNATIAQAQAENKENPNAGLAQLGELEARGLSVVDGLPDIDLSHAWDEASKTVITVTPPPVVRSIGTAVWILRFTSAEFQAITQSGNADVQHLLFAVERSLTLDLNDANVVNGVNLLAALGLIDQARIAAIMA